MKRIYVTLACCLIAHTFCLAQEFPQYGVLTDEERNLKQCSFDKDADAVVLLHEAFSDYDEEHHLVTTHHIRIKILNEKGFHYATVSIPYYRKDDFEQIDMVAGMTINAQDDHPETQLDRKSIFTKKTNERFGEVVFAFPAIKTGSMVEYKYRSTMKHYGGLEDWNFQEQLPVMVSKYTLIILPNMEFAYRINKTLDIPVTITKESFRGGVYFEMRNIPGLGDEPYMDARRDYLQRAIFQLSSYGRDGIGKKNYMTSWDEVTRELSMIAEFGGQLSKNIAGTDDFIKQVKALPLAEDKMKAVFNYVRANMNWNHIYSKYSNEGVKDAWQKKSGTSGDINLLLVNLLKEAGLDAYPMLVSERFHGKVDIAYPFIDQFNSVFAYVAINNKKYYLDGTDKAIPPHLTPANILNATAFIVNRKNGGLTNITNDTLQYKEYILADLDLAENGSLSGEVNVKSFDYARMQKLQDYKASPDKFMNRYFTVEGTGIAAKELKLENIGNDSMELEQHGAVYGTLSTTGDYTFLPLNLFTGFDANPFLRESRFSNINFGYRRTVGVNISMHLPANYTVEELPKSVKMTNPDMDIVFVRQVEYDKADNELRCMMQFEFKKSLYEADSYPIIKEVYQKMFGFLKEPVVLKHK